MSVKRPPRYTAREAMTRVLAAAGVPLRAMTMRDLLLRDFGMDVPPNRITGTMGAERRAYRSGTRQDVLAPAIDAATLSPFRGWYTLSEWPFHRRVISTLAYALEAEAAALARSAVPTNSQHEVTIDRALARWQQLDSYAQTFGILEAQT
ncbi:MAG: hypothetical protein ACYDA1_04310 [Vulcanimicrobiaceae bacterium]